MCSPRRGAAEVQFLGQDNEITKLAQLHTCHHLPLCGSDGLRGGGDDPGRARRLRRPLAIQRNYRARMQGNAQALALGDRPW